MACLVLVASIVTLHGYTTTGTPMHLAGEVWDCRLLGSLLMGVSDAMAELYDIPFHFDVSGYQMADRAFIFTSSAMPENFTSYLEPHLQEVFDRVGDLAMPFLRGLPIYLGVVHPMILPRDPELWVVLTYNDPSDIEFEYLGPRSAVLEGAREFSQALEREIGEGITFALEGCLAVPRLGAYIELRMRPLGAFLPDDLDSYDEWEALLLDLVESDGASLFTALAADESLFVVLANSYFRIPDYSRTFFVIPSATYLDTSTWQIWSQDW